MTTIGMAKYARDVAVPRKKLQRLIDDWEALTDCLEWIIARAEQGGNLEEIAVRARETLSNVEPGTTK